MSDAASGDGVVLSDQGSQVIVDIDGKEVGCVIRKSLRRGRRSKVVVVGDRVTVKEGAVVAVRKRRSTISRTDPSNRHREQVLVANLDALLIVVAARNPALVPGLIDRFVVAAESRELEIGIVINKVDLDPDRDYAAVADLYSGLGYPTLPVASLSGEGVQAVRDFLTDKTTAMLGHSGVGKSSLANAMDADLRLTTGDVHEGTGLGTHTTSAVSLLRLPWGGYLVDTPGIREFSLWRMDPQELRFRFREIEALQAACRFNDCLHDNEPDCAVKRAVEAQEINPSRFDSYLRILVSLKAEQER